MGFRSVVWHGFRHARDFDERRSQCIGPTADTMPRLSAAYSRVRLIAICTIMAASGARTSMSSEPTMPKNRLVAGELERRWNTALAAVRALEEEMEALLRQRPPALSAEERQRLLQMGADLEAAWHHPAANAVTRKRIIRVVLREVVARVEDDQIQLLLHWQGGDHTRLSVRKNRRGQTRWSVEPETMELIRACAGRWMR